MATRIAPVEMIQRRFGYFPRTFYMNKEQHTVEKVERVWVTSKGGNQDRHYFDVICKDGAFELYQDLSKNTWHGRKVG